MNRSIALFVALVLLLAHILAIHNDGEGYFAYPYDQAFVALRLARNWVGGGELAWNAGMPAFESYPSIAWIVFAAIGDALARVIPTLKVPLFLQTVGVLSVLFTVILMAHFRADRAAGLIAPLLLVTSGTIAAAAASGLETGFFMLAIVAAFWSAERDYSRRFALALAACALARPEAIVIIAGLFVLRLLARVRLMRSAPATRSGRQALWPFLVPLAIYVAIVLVRRATTGHTLSPTLTALLHPYSGQLIGGLISLREFLAVTVSLLLLGYPLVYLVRGKLSRLGWHALVIALSWAVVCAWQGRSPLPFGQALVPALPLVFLAIQEGMIEALDGKWQAARRLALVALGVCLAGSALASKVPGRLGPIATERWHEAWMMPSGSARFGYDQPLARLGLVEEIAHTQRLHELGRFMAAQIDARYSVLTPWPGVIGALTHARVIDVLGRTDPAPGASAPAAWTRRERADVLAQLEARPDYVVPWVDPLVHGFTLRELAEAWRLELDSHADVPDRQRAIEKALRQFELITVPLYGEKRGTAPRRSAPFMLLRRRDLGLQPKLAIVHDEGSIRIEVRHASHHQLADLSVQITDDRDRTWSVRPTGALALDPTVQARVAILLYDTRERAIELLRLDAPTLPDGARITAVKAVLRNPNNPYPHPFAAVSDEALLRFE